MLGGALERKMAPNWKRGEKETSLAALGGEAFFCVSTSLGDEEALA